MCILAVLAAVLLPMYGCGGGGNNNSAPAATSTPTVCSAPPLTTEYSRVVFFEGENADGVTTNCGLIAGDSAVGQLAVVTCRNDAAFAGFGGGVSTAVSADIEFVFADTNENGIIDDSELTEGLSASAAFTVEGDLLLANNRRTLLITNYRFGDFFSPGYVDADCVSSSSRSLKAEMPEDADTTNEQNMLSLHGTIGDIVSDGPYDSDVTKSDIEDIMTILDRLGTGENPQ